MKEIEVLIRKLNNAFNLNPNVLQLISKNRKSVDKKPLKVYILL